MLNSSSSIFAPPFFKKKKKKTPRNLCSWAPPTPSTRPSCPDKSPWAAPPANGGGCGGPGTSEDRSEGGGRRWRRWIFPKKWGVCGFFWRKNWWISDKVWEILIFLVSTSQLRLSICQPIPSTLTLRCLSTRLFPNDPKAALCSHDGSLGRGGFRFRAPLGQIGDAAANLRRRAERSASGFCKKKNVKGFEVTKEGQKKNYTWSVIWSSFMKHCTDYLGKLYIHRTSLWELTLQLSTSKNCSKPKTPRRLVCTWLWCRSDRKDSHHLLARRACGAYCRVQPTGRKRNSTRRRRTRIKENKIDE